MAIEHLFIWITLFFAPIVSFLVLLSLKRNIDRLGQLPYLVAMSEILLVLLYSSELNLATQGIILMTYSMVFGALFALVIPGAAKDFHIEYLDLPLKQTRKITEDLLLEKGWTIAYSKNSPLMFEAPSKFGRVRGKITLRKLEGKTLVGIESTIGIQALTLLSIISLASLFLSGMVFSFIGAGVEDFWLQEESVIVFPILGGIMTLIFTQNSSRIGNLVMTSLDRYLVDKATQIILAQHVAQRILTAPKRSKKEEILQKLEKTKNLAAKFIKQSDEEDL